MLAGRMAFVTVIASEVIGECDERIRVEVSRKVLSMALVCPGFFRLGAQCLDGFVVRLRCWH